MKRNRVNVLTVVNSASNIITEVIDGDEHIIVRDNGSRRHHSR